MPSSTQAGQAAAYAPRGTHPSSAALARCSAPPVHDAHVRPASLAPGDACMHFIWVPCSCGLACRFFCACKPGHTHNHAPPPCSCSPAPLDQPASAPHTSADAYACARTQNTRTGTHARTPHTRARYTCTHVRTHHGHARVATHTHIHAHARTRKLPFTPPHTHVRPATNRPRRRASTCSSASPAAAASRWSCRRPSCGAPSPTSLSGTRSWTTSAWRWATCGATAACLRARPSSCDPWPAATCRARCRAAATWPRACGRGVRPGAGGGGGGEECCQGMGGMLTLAWRCSVCSR